MAQSLAFSRRASSASTAPRMNCARLFGPARASIRSRTSGSRRTRVGFSPSAGLPMRERLAGIALSDNVCIKPLSLIDEVTDNGYITVIANRGKQMHISIMGYEGECSCDHCGRSLSHGVRTDTHGVIGADCFNKLIKADRKKFSRDGKPGASMIRTYAKLRERDSWDSLARIGYGPHHFVFEVA